MAVAIFSSKNDASFIKNVQNALKWLFFAGMQGQPLLPTLVFEPLVVQDSIDGIEDQPRWSTMKVHVTVVNTGYVAYLFCFPQR